MFSLAADLTDSGAFRSDSQSDISILSPKISLLSNASLFEDAPPSRHHKSMSGGPRRDSEMSQDVSDKYAQNIHRIQKTLIELKQVAHSIMQTYIYDGSVAQVNLPGKLR
jgi:hypothetical protein